jgi:hypothetical protein
MRGVPAAANDDDLVAHVQVHAQRWRMVAAVSEPSPPLVLDEEDLVAKGRDAVSRVKPHSDGRVDAGGLNAEPLGDLVGESDAVLPVDPEQRSTVRKYLGTRPVAQHIFNDPLHDGPVLVTEFTVAGEIDDMLGLLGEESAYLRRLAHRPPSWVDTPRMGRHSVSPSSQLLKPVCSARCEVDQSRVSLLSRSGMGMEASTSAPR